MKIVLINTTHPGNIGATARAMKNMGFAHLCLVAPKIFPSEEASARASGAQDILEMATVVGSLDEALVDCHWAFGLSARVRKISAPILSSREAALEIVRRAQKAPQHKIALLFGQEQSGLLNTELERCHFQIMIPANPHFPSLNLAQAVQIMTYELRMALDIQTNLVVDALLVEGEEVATLADMESFYEHLAQTLMVVGFLNPQFPGHLMAYLRRLFSRRDVTKRELNILRGILTAVQKRV